MRDHGYIEKRHFGVIDLMKFIAVIGIVYFHTLNNQQRHFDTTYLLVEFFFFLSGYFTFKHFDEHSDSKLCDLNSKAKISILYTLRKLRSFFVFVVIAIVLWYITLAMEAVVNEWSAQEIIKAICNLPFELLLLNSQSGFYIWPMWFLSAMIIVLPVFSLLCQSKNRNVVFIFSSLLCIIYYFNYFAGWSEGILSLVRAFFGLLMGLNIYIISDYVKHICISKRVQRWLLIVEIILPVLTLISMYPSSGSVNAHIFNMLTLLTFFIYLCIFMSEKTFMSTVQNSVMNYLGRLSMIIFMIHLPIKNIIDYCLPAAVSIERSIVIIIVSVVFSSIVLLLVNSIKQKIKSRQKLCADRG